MRSRVKGDLWTSIFRPALGKNVDSGKVWSGPGRALHVTEYTDERGDWQRVRSAGFELLKKPMLMAILLEHLHSAIEKREEA